MNIDAYALGQSVLNVAMIVYIIKLKLRVDSVDATKDRLARDWIQEIDMRLEELERADGASSAATTIAPDASSSGSSRSSP